MEEHSKLIRECFGLEQKQKNVKIDEWEKWGWRLTEDKQFFCIINLRWLNKGLNWI